MATNVLGLMDYVQKQGEQGRQQGQQQYFNRLAGQAYTAPAAQQGALVGQMVGVDPQAGMAVGSALAGQNKAAETDHMKRLGGAARYMAQALQTKNSSQIQGAWQAVRPYLAELTGKETPEQWDPSFEPGVYRAIAMTGGTPDVKGVVANQGAQVIDPSTGRVMASIPFGQKYQDVPMGEGQAAGSFDPNTGIVRPAVGGGAQGDPMQPLIEQANHAVQLGADPAKVEAWLQQQAASMGGQPIAPSGQSPQGQAQAMQPPAAMPQTQPATAQFGVGTPKAGSGPDSFRAARPEELKMLGLPEGSAAQINTKTGKFDVISKPAALSPDKLADVAVKRQKVEQAKQESVATFNDSITKIDDLLNDPSFGSLGTFTGDIAAKIPHTDTANANAQLDTISAQSVINVLSSLKSLSSNGSSGFGALSEKEGEILRNAAANLSTSQGNAAIKKNLLELRQKLERSRDRVAAQQIKLPEDSVGQQAAAPAQGGWSIQRVQ